MDGAKDDDLDGDFGNGNDLGVTSTRKENEAGVVSDDETSSGDKDSSYGTDGDENDSTSTYGGVETPADDVDGDRTTAAGDNDSTFAVTNGDENGLAGGRHDDFEVAEGATDMAHGRFLPLNERNHACPLPVYAVVKSIE